MIPDGMSDAEKARDAAATKYATETETIVLNADQMDAEAIIYNLRAMAFSAGFEEALALRDKQLRELVVKWRKENAEHKVDFYGQGSAAGRCADELEKLIGGGE